MHPLSLALFALSLFGLALAALQAFTTLRHRRRAAPRPRKTPPISILKPLCGHDDDLATNLELFATAIDYPDYEVVLGIRSPKDGAYPAAREAARRFPGRIRLVLQQGEPGYNPKVNQLVTLARAAKHDLFVISDSNVQVGPGYLAEIAAHFEDPRVGLVTNPTVGVGEARLGALLDNLHMTCGIGAGMIAAKAVANQDLVVGKSMAMRRADVEALGGFEAVKDVLAEDFVVGKLVSTLLGKTVVIAQEPVFNVTRGRSVAEFVKRFERWSVMQRAAVGTPTYLAQSLLQPVSLSLAAFAIDPTTFGAGLLLSSAAVKCGLDGLSGAALRPGGFSIPALAAAPLKDVLVAWAWARGLAKDTVDWRGNLLRVRAGTRLEPVRPMAAPVPAPAIALRRAA